MTREESSVMSSLQQLMVEEDRRRAEQIALAHRRKLEQERELLEQEQRRAEYEQRRSEAAKRQALQRAAEDRAEHERQELERVVELERVRSELEQRTRVAVRQTDQRHELERLAILRDRQVARLEGQRLMISALLGTLLAGSALLYVALIRPESKRQERLVSQLNQASLTQQAERDRERERLDSKILDLQDVVTQLNSELKEANLKLSQRETKKNSGVVPPPTGGGHRRVKSEICTNPNDPLCGNLNAI
jgi:hypothetical protein